MAIRVRCPGCRAVLGLPESAAEKQSIRCPRCRATVPVPRQVDAVLDEPEEEEPAAAAKKTKAAPETAQPPPWTRYHVVGMLIGVIVIVLVGTVLYRFIF